MNTETIIECLKLGVTLVCGGLALYLKFSAKAQTKAKQVQETISNITAKAVIFIKEAEEKYKDTTNMGGTKFNEVVIKLHSLVPDPLKNIITKDMIADIVQSTFDEIEEYVQLQLDNAINEGKE
jgi:hypothetical protein